MKDYKITLHQNGTNAVAQMALQHFDAVQAMNKARRCMGNDWFVVTLIETV
jgi:hypothetical protein